MSDDNIVFFDLETTGLGNFMFILLFTLYYNK